MAHNRNLIKAKAAKNDEFYTCLSDVENELLHYKEHFKDKVIFCNCNDSEESAFWIYFHKNFKHFGLKKLIATTYNKNGSLIKSMEKQAYKMVYDGTNSVGGGTVVIQTLQ